MGAFDCHKAARLENDMVAANEINEEQIGKVKNYHLGKDEETPVGRASAL